MLKTIFEAALKTSRSRWVCCLLLIAVLVGSTTVSVSPVSAQPPLPALFYGSVTISGSPAPAGTVIQAQISSVVRGTYTVVTAGSYDNMLVTDGNNGDTVQFYINGVAAQTTIYRPGERNQVNLSTGGGGSAPAAPVLSSPFNGATSISTAPTLQWSASSGATSYGVQVSTSSGFTTTVFSQTGITATQVTVTPALTASTLYYWRTNASNTYGTSAWSTTWSFTTVSTPAPAAPTLLSPANGATGAAISPLLQWSSVTGATSYAVQVSTSSSFGSTVFSQSSLTATAVTVTPALSSSTIYYWRANATGPGGTSAWSTTWSFTTTGGGTPSIPAFFRGVAYKDGAAVNAKQVCATTSSGSVCVTSDASGGYLIQINGSPGGTVTFTVDGASASETATFQPGWMTTLNLHALTYTLNVTTNSATYATATTATLSGSITGWNPSDTSATTYFVWGTTSGGPYSNTVTATPSSFTTTGSFTGTLSGLTSGQVCYIKAKATGTSSGDKYGTELTYTHTVGQLTVTSNSATYATATTATLSGSITGWNPSDASAATSFVWGSTSGGPYSNTVTATPSSFTTTGSFTGTLSGLTSGQVCYIKAKATGTSSGDKFGSEITYTHSATVQLTVVTNSATYATTTTATLSGSITGWNSSDTSAATSFVWGSTSGGPYSNTVTATPSSFTTTGSFTGTLSGLTSGQVCYIKAKAVGTSSGEKYGSQITYTHSGGCGGDPVGCTVGTIAGKAGPYVAVYNKYAATSSTSITKINVKCFGSGVARVAIYSDNAGQVGTLLNANNTETAVTEGVTSITIPSTSITSGTYYWLATWTNGLLFVLANEAGTYATQTTNSSFNFPTTPTGTIYYGAGARGLISGSN